MKKRQKAKGKRQKCNLKVKSFNFLLVLFTFYFLPFTSLMFAQDSSEYVSKAWALLGERKFNEVYQTTGECIEKFGLEAEKNAATLTDFPSQGSKGDYKIMNDVATCYFIRAEALMREQKVEEAKMAFSELIEKYPYAQSYDPRGWFWSIKEKSEISLKKLITGEVEEVEEKEAVISKIILYDEGTEFPVDYSKYGEFIGRGTKDYKYIIRNPIGLSEAVGEGIYPNTTSVKFDPEFVKIKNKILKIDHWQILNRRDLSVAFYKWTFAPEAGGVKLFYLADILERSGLVKHAIKAYYAVLVHFPNTVGWTYWHTPWYIGKAALYRIKYLLENNPDLGLKLDGARIEIVNGFDNEIRNDIFIVEPGNLTAISFWKNIVRKGEIYKTKRKESGKIAKAGGTKRVALVKYENGNWQFQVEGKPFMIKGITYSPTKVGESPDEGTLQDWTAQDLNNNGLIDAPYESWLDKNRNDTKDDNEAIVGDFALMKEMGVNCIRLYHQPFRLNKELLRKMHNDYGIYVAIGDFLGKYALGSNASWEEGTDYDNPLHKKNMRESVKKMVMEFKDEDAVLFWILGNENVYGLGCNANKNPESFFKFADKAAKLIKSLDPQKRPVAIASGDLLFLDIFAKNCPNIDIFGTNSYRGHHGFLDLWDEIARVAAKPALITEYGAPSYSRGYTQEEAENYQAKYHRNCWLDILNNRCEYGAGVALGGFAFEWTDEWWKAYEPAYHDKKGLFTGPFLDGYMHEEWLGLTAQGDGKNSPYLRQLKQAYFTYKKLWTEID